MTDRTSCPAWCATNHARNAPEIRLHHSGEIVVPVSTDFELAAGLLADELAEALRAWLERLWLEVYVAGVSHDAGP